MLVIGVYWYYRIAKGGGLARMFYGFTILMSLFMLPLYLGELTGRWPDSWIKMTYFFTFLHLVALVMLYMPSSNKYFRG